MSSPAPTVPNPFSWQNAANSLAGAAGGIAGQAVNAGIGTLGQMAMNGQVSGNTAASLNAQNLMTKEQLGQQQAQYNSNMALKQSELARRNMMQGVAAPSVLRSLGYRNPDDISKIQAQFQQQQAPAQILGTPTPTTTSATPPNAQAATGNYQMSQTASASPVFGKGRTAADSFVNSVENPFGADLANIVKQKDSGDIPGAAAAFQQKYAQYQAAVAQQMQMGGKEALAAQQSLANQGLQQTIQTLAQQLGVKI